MNTFMEICDGIKETLEAAAGIKTAESYNELSETPPAADCPKLQVYPASGTSDKFARTDRTAFSAGVQQEGLLIYADLYARQRSQLDEDMQATMEMIEAIRQELRAQERPPFFGRKNIRAFKWTWSRRTFRITKGVLFMGARFELDLTLF